MKQSSVVVVVVMFFWVKNVPIMAFELCLMNNVLTICHFSYVKVRVPFAICFSQIEFDKEQRSQFLKTLFLIFTWCQSFFTMIFFINYFSSVSLSFFLISFVVFYFEVDYDYKYYRRQRLKCAIAIWQPFFAFFRKKVFSILVFIFSVNWMLTRQSVVVVVVDTATGPNQSLFCT